MVGNPANVTSLHGLLTDALVASSSSRHDRWDIVEITSASSIGQRPAHARVVRLIGKKKVRIA
jgi:hypothetical protein